MPDIKMTLYMIILINEEIGMSTLRLTLFAVFMILILSVQTGLAATVDGNAFKADQTTDHSGITVQLETLPGVPAVGLFGIAFLLGGLSLVLYRRRNRFLGVSGILLIVSGLSCITYAFATYTAVTNMAGEYSMTAVDPGEYRLDASAPGYYPEQLVPITIHDGVNTLPDVTLYPVTTPTPLATDTPTLPPTETPTQTPGFVSVGNMITISAGTFTQGSPPTEPCRDTDETQFIHTLTRNLYVMETEITRQMWADLAARQPSLPADPSHTTTSPSPAHPVQQNTWFEAVLFANLLSLQNGFSRCYYTDSGFTMPIDASNYTAGPFYCDLDADGYRLPIEGEWEYVTRAGTTGPFSADEPNYDSGTCNTCNPTPSLDGLNGVAWWCGNSASTTHPAGEKSGNPWNLKDVHGNVWEWCWDWYGSYPAGPEINHIGQTPGMGRVLRGGGWVAFAGNCRSAVRLNFAPDSRSAFLGFRLVQTRLPDQAGDLYAVDPIVKSMRFVPGGTFTQGSPEDEPCRSGEEDQFLHTLTRNIAVMQTEITRQMWIFLAALQPTLPADPSDPTYSSTTAHPVQMVPWYQTLLFANLLSIQNGHTRCYYKDSGFTIPIDDTNYSTPPFCCDFDADGYRLPTEGEWEYFARAGTSGVFWITEANYDETTCDICSPVPPLTDFDTIAWWCGNSSNIAHPVGEKPANPWNLRDVHGNVWEWCFEGYTGAYPTGSQTDYFVDPSSTAIMFRGGSFLNASEYCRSAKRNMGARDYATYRLGFRLVRTVD